MSDFTDELRHENYEIIQILAKAKQHGMRTLQGRRILFDHMSTILNHMKKEDEKIHETLAKSTSYHPSLKQSLEMFKDETEKTSMYIRGFFKKHKANNATKELSDDFEVFLKVMTHRIEKEENIFYAEYDEIEKEEELLKKMML